MLSTLRDAADRDYRLFVLADLCADRDPEVHRVLLEKVFPRQADVVGSDRLAALLGGRHQPFASASPANDSDSRCVAAGTGRMSE